MIDGRSPAGSRRARNHRAPSIPQHPTGAALLGAVAALPAPAGRRQL